MKRDVEKAKQLLRTLVALSIYSSKTRQTLREVGSALEGIQGEGSQADIDECAKLVNEEIDKLKKQRAIINAIRSKGETIVWNRQVVSPRLKDLVTDLELSEMAMKCIPIGVETIGQLCQYSGSELRCSSSRHVNEIRDILRALGLVLKPEGK